ncbi:hypothetical protein AAMO2058_000983600 [Amorphochlora amoebiformis]
MVLSVLITLGYLALPSASICPYMASNYHDEPLPAGHLEVSRNSLESGSRRVTEEYLEALSKVDFGSVKKDLLELFQDSKDFWPADYGNYGPLFVRLAWHNAGSYRISDGRGGPDGGHQRFDPERSWDDNTNLDKARALLQPIKLKYGQGLSWGDLIILAGNTAIESMGGPILGICAGSTTVGLIYLNPEGPLGEPDPRRSALEVRDAFARMAMNDSETVALIGGGHAFGKTHGACPKGAGPSPKEDPENPWPGLCGTGKGKDAFTSGFEGPWTAEPTKWDYSYFLNLIDYEWEVHVGPGGHWQWRVKGGDGPVAPGAFGGSQDVMLLTSDVSLKFDPAGIYQRIIREFATNPASFDHAFKHAWYKLTTRDMGPVTRCLGSELPPPQPFQYPLPKPLPKEDLANFTLVSKDLRDLLQSFPAFAKPKFVRLAWRCASTYRHTDYLGGCDGARIRFSPEKDWPINKYLNLILASIEPLKNKYGKGLSWADLIVQSLYLRAVYHRNICHSARVEQMLLT